MGDANENQSHSRRRRDILITPCKRSTARGKKRLPLLRTPRIFAPAKKGADFSTDVVFLLRSRERIVSDLLPDKSNRLYRSVGTAAILYFPTSLDEVLRDVTNVTISHKKHEERLCGDSDEVLLI